MCSVDRHELKERAYTYLDATAKSYRVSFVEKKSDKAKAMLAENPVSFPVLFDSNSDVSKLYNVDAMPTTVMVDRDGNMRHLHRGFKPGFEDNYAAQVKGLFREQYAISDE